MPILTTDPPAATAPANDSEFRPCLCGCGSLVRRFAVDGKERHYRRGHAPPESAQGKTNPVVCANCGKGCLVKRGRLHRGAPFYCGDQCRGQASRRDRDLTCFQCGKRFQRKSYRQPYAHDFCSLKCAGAFRSTLPRLEVPVTCSNCGRTFKVWQFKLRLNRNFYCNPKCRAAHIVGKNNPSFTDGAGRKRKYGPNWRQQARKAYLRDGYRCTHCGKKPKNRRHLHAHHIRPFRRFNGDWKSANQLPNLITLCLKCHKRAEKGKIQFQLPLPFACI